VVVIFHIKNVKYIKLKRTSLLFGGLTKVRWRRGTKAINIKIEKPLTGHDNASKNPLKTLLNSIGFIGIKDI
jgi:hypothetical protein